MIGDLRQSPAPIVGYLPARLQRNGDCPPGRNSAAREFGMAGTCCPGQPLYASAAFEVIPVRRAPILPATRASGARSDDRRASDGEPHHASAQENEIDV